VASKLKPEHNRYSMGPKLRTDSGLFRGYGAQARAPEVAERGDGGAIVQTLPKAHPVARWSREECREPRPHGPCICGFRHPLDCAITIRSERGTNIDHWGALRCLPRRTLEEAARDLAVTLREWPRPIPARLGEAPDVLHEIVVEAGVGAYLTGAGFGVQEVEGRGVHVALRRHERNQLVEYDADNLGWHLGASWSDGSG